MGKLVPSAWDDYVSCGRPAADKNDTTRTVHKHEARYSHACGRTQQNAVLMYV